MAKSKRPYVYDPAKEKAKRVKFIAAGRCSKRGCYLDDKRFKTCSNCRKVGREKSRRGWAQGKVRSAVAMDVIVGYFVRGAIPPDFIDKEWVLNTREEQQNKCTVCGIVLQIENMNLHDGLTIDRLDEDVAHVKSNCVINCYKCNIRRVLGVDLYVARRRAEVMNGGGAE